MAQIQKPCFWAKNNDPIRRPNHFRIGTLEGAIMAAILQLESNRGWMACSGSSLAVIEAEKTRQVIANLKELIGNNQ